MARTQAEEDLADLSLVVARMLTSGPERYSLDEILQRFGYTREQLRDFKGPKAGRKTKRRKS